MKKLFRSVSVILVLCMTVALFTGFAGAAQISSGLAQTLKLEGNDVGFATEYAGQAHFVDAGREGDAVTARLSHKLAVPDQSVAVAVRAVDANGNPLSGHKTRFVLGSSNGNTVTVTYQENGCRYFAMVPVQGYIEQGTIHHLETTATKLGGGMYNIYVEARLIMSDDLAEYVVVNKTDERLLNMRFTCFLENEVIDASHNVELQDLKFEDPHGIYDLIEEETYAAENGLMISYKLNEEEFRSWRYTGAAELKDILQTEVIMSCSARVHEDDLRPVANEDDEIWTYGHLDLTYEVGGRMYDIPAVRLDTIFIPANLAYVVLDEEGYDPGWDDDEDDDDNWFDEDDREQAPIPGWLNGKDHVAYIIGYEGDVVRPGANITRAEVATIFFRLLNNSVREEAMTWDNDFSDVQKGQWFNCAISTMASLNVLNGYPDGTFRPNAPITRAEFAAIAARFDGREAGGIARFSDIRGHWSAAEVSRAYLNRWVDGYPDGTFRPDRDITRAEAMTLVNRVLHRNPETVEDLLPDMVIWKDNMDENAWYYLAVQEATNSHDYNRKRNTHENWLYLEENPDWALLEK